MAITKSWDDTVPAGTDDPRDGDNEIRDLKTALEERLKEGTGLSWPDGTVATSGRPVCGAQATDKYTIYESDIATIAMELDENVGKVTFGAAGGYDIVGQRYQTVSIPLPTNAVGDISGIAIMNRGGGTMEIREAQLSAFTAPSGGGSPGVEVMPKKIAGPIATTDSLLVKAATNVLTSALSIADTEFHSAVLSADGAFNDRDIDVGDALIVNIATNAGSADDLILTLLIRRTS